MAMNTVLLFTVLLGSAYPYKILVVFPSPIFSHHWGLKELIEELVRTNNDITLVTPHASLFKDTNSTNLVIVDVNSENLQKLTQNIPGNPRKRNHQQRTGFQDFLKVLMKAFELELETDNFKRLIRDKNTKYDLLITQSSVIRSASVFSHHFKLPTVQVNSFGASFGNLDKVGGVTHPILYPLTYSRRIHDLTFIEKIYVTYHYYEKSNLDYYREPDENALLEKHIGSDLPSISDISKSVDMLFLKINPLWDGNRPVPLSVVFIEESQVRPPIELSKELRSFMDSSEHGIIYVSFGTNVATSSLQAEKLSIMKRVFSELPYNVLWKWDADVMTDQPKNVFISKWFPQRDLLMHPKVKLFITHAGLHSTEDALLAGVPLLGMPIFADHWYNAEKYRYFKIGEKIDFFTLTEDGLRNAIKNIIQNESYRESASNLQFILRDQPQPALRRAVWWTEYLLRHGGGGHLRSPAANITLIDYFELELVTIVLTTTISAICFVILSVRKVFKVIF